jgi:predicted transcriptional regulator
MRKAPLGDLELETFNFVAGRAPVSVGEAAVEFGEPRGLARTTILTVMENLRKKGYLKREKMEGAFQYSPQIAPAAVLKDMVSDFVEHTLSGSLTPFVAYAAETQELTAEELAELDRLIAKLPQGKKGDRKT